MLSLYSIVLMSLYYLVDYQTVCIKMETRPSEGTNIVTCEVVNHRIKVLILGKLYGEEDCNN